MRYTVLMKPVAEQQLAATWIAAPDRQAVTDAANTIDRLLKLQPETAGESRGGNTRVVIVEPLAVHFEVLEEDRIVNILNVTSIR